MTFTTSSAPAFYYYWYPEPMRHGLHDDEQPPTIMHVWYCHHYRSMVERPLLACAETHDPRGLSCGWHELRPLARTQRFLPADLLPPL